MAGNGFAIVSICFFLILASISGGFGRNAPGADSPEALLQRAQAAAAAGDVAELMACIAPEDRAGMVVALAAGVTMMVGFMRMGTEMMGGMAEGIAEAFHEEGLSDERKAEIEKEKTEAAAKFAELEAELTAIFQKHGAEDLLATAEADSDAGSGDGDRLRKLPAGVDDIALATDLLAFFGEAGQEGPGVGELSVSELDIDFNSLAVDGERATVRDGDEEIEMVKVEGRWYLRLPEAAGAVID